MKLTASGAVPDVGVPENSAVGAVPPGETVMYEVLVSTSLPYPFVAVSDTV